MGVRSPWRRLIARVLFVSLLAAGMGSLRPAVAASMAEDVVEAARAGDGDLLRTLIQEGADVNAASGDGTTALHWASHRDDVESVRLLISAGGDVNAANDLGATPLWAASMNGSEVMVETLLAAGANPNASLLHGETPLMVASQSGNAAVVEMLLEHGADPNATGPRDQTALMWAVADRYPDVVAVLLEHGADVQARSEVWTQLMAHAEQSNPENNAWFEHGGNTALMFAARVGDLASARHLVAAGADVNDTNAWGVSTVAMAAYSNFRTFVASPAFAGGGPFYLGGREGFRSDQFTGLVEFLLEQGADPDLGAEKFTALHAAIMRRDDAAVDLLLEHDADPNLSLGTFIPIQRSSNLAFYFHRGWVGASPAWLAARFGTPYILRRLVERGADPSFVHRGIYYGNGFLGTALGGGIFEDRIEDVTTLLMAAVGMSETGRAWVYEFPSTEEHEAEILEKARLLVELGVEVNAVNHEGVPAVVHAREEQFDSVVGFLVEAGAELPAEEGDEAPSVSEETVASTDEQDVHIQQVMQREFETLDEAGFLNAALAEAAVARLHAGYAAGGAENPGDLGSMQIHAAHVLHAIDPEAIDEGPGFGFGVKQAAARIIHHIEIAAASDHAGSEDVRIHAERVGTLARNTAERAQRIIELVRGIMEANSAEEADPLADELEAVATQLNIGADANGDGEITLEAGEGGLEHAKLQMELMMDLIANR